MIIAVDFDGTLQISKEPNTGLIRSLKAEQNKGNIVILWTCREGPSLIEALEFLWAVGFRPNYVNQNAPEVIRKFRRDPRKIYADVYIDDKARC